MAQMTGIVNCLLVADDYAAITIDDGTGDTETFVLWYNPSPSELNPNTRRVQGMWVALLQDAKIHNLIVNVQTRSDTNFMEYVQLGRATSSPSEPL